MGDTVTAQTTLDEVSEEKQTRLGSGFFVTWLTTYTDGDGAVVVASSPEQFTAFVQRETDNWTKVIRTAGITAD